eukprot:5219979-Pyramimonas_sp.AAC.1
MERLTRDMRTFELQTTFEEVFPVQGTTVEEYLQQVRTTAHINPRRKIAVSREGQSSDSEFHGIPLSPPKGVGLDSDTAELTIKTFLSHLVTREFDCSANSLRTPYMSVWSPRKEARVRIGVRTLVSTSG